MEQLLKIIIVLRLSPLFSMRNNAARRVREAILSDMPSFFSPLFFTNTSFFLGNINHMTITLRTVVYSSHYHLPRGGGATTKATSLVCVSIHVLRHTGSTVNVTISPLSLVSSHPANPPHSHASSHSNVSSVVKRHISPNVKTPKRLQGDGPARIAGGGAS